MAIEVAPPPGAAGAEIRKFSRTPGIQVTIQLWIGDEIINWCIEEMLNHRMTPSKVSIKKIRDRAAQAYEMYGLQTHGEVLPSQVGFDIDDAGVDDVTWQVIKRVRKRLGLPAPDEE